MQKEKKKASDKTQYSFIIKTFNRQEIKENFLNLTKGIYEKPTANILPDDETYFFPPYY